MVLPNEPVSRDQILRRECGQGNINFPCAQLTTCRIGNFTRLIHTLDVCVTIIPYNICRRPGSHTFVFFPFAYLEMSLFPSIFCTIAVFSLYGEYIVRSFLPDGLFLTCDHGLDF